MKITPGATNVSLYVYFVDDDGGTAPGEPTTGKLFSDIETGGSASYVRQGAARTDVTLITLASASAAHADGGFILVDDTNMPGLYRVDIPDAAFASGVDFVIIQLVMAAANNSIMRPLLVELSAPQAGDSFVRLGAPVGASMSADVAVVDLNVDQIETAVITNAVGADISADVATAQADLDTITDADGVVLGAAAVDLIWDEVLTGGTHNVTNSSGRRIRELEDATLIRGDAFQAGSTINSLVLDASASALDNFYRFTIIRIIDGPAAGQERIIAESDGTTKAVTITPPLVTAAPDSGDEFKIITGGSVHAETQGGGYEGGAVWLDTVNGSAGTLLYVNGTVDNPSNNIADVRTLLDALGMRVIQSVPGSSYTLAQSFNNFQFIGSGYTIALGGQDIGGSRFFNCAISGTGTGSSRVVFRECILVGATTLSVSSLIGCNFSADLTLSAAGTYRISDGIHGSAASPIVDFGAAVLNTIVHIHGYRGAVTVQNMGQAGTDTLHFDSPGGQLTLDSTNIGGTVNMNGTFGFVDSSTGMTINKAGAIVEVVGVAGAGLTGIPWNAAWDAEVESEVNDALDTVIAELAVAAPAATPTIRTALMLLYMALRNRTDVQTSGTDALEIFNDAGTMIAQKLLTDAGGDYSEAKVISG